MIYAIQYNSSLLFCPLTMHMWLLLTSFYSIVLYICTYEGYQYDWTSRQYPAAETTQDQNHEAESGQPEEPGQTSPASSGIAPFPPVLAELMNHYIECIARAGITTMHNTDVLCDQRNALENYTIKSETGIVNYFPVSLLILMVP